MQSNKEIISNIKPFDYSQYKDITSFEKLMVYAAKFLTDNSIPLTFNYLCVTSYNMFPEVFCLDDEFKQHLSPDRLNRTYVHLKYTKKNPYIIGTQEKGFYLTNFGIQIAEEVKAILQNSTIDKKIKAPSIDMHKRGNVQDYKKIKESALFKKYVDEKLIDLNLLWDFENVIPFTQVKRIKSKFLQIARYCHEIKDTDLANFIEEILRRI